MPAAFAHDLYGRKVYMEADPVIKRIIKKERYCFLLRGARTGCPVLLQGTRKEQGEPERRADARANRAAKLIGAGPDAGPMRRRHKDERDEMIAYLMGVACHFCLGQPGPRLRERGGEADRDHPRGDRDGAGDGRLLEREHMRPLHSNLTCHLKITAQTVRASSRLFDEDPDQGGKGDHELSDHEPAVHQLERDGRSGSAASCLRFTGCYGVIHGMFMRKQPTPGCEADHRPSGERIPRGSPGRGGASERPAYIPERKRTDCRNCFRGTLTVDRNVRQ